MVKVLKMKQGTWPQKDPKLKSSNLHEIWEKTWAVFAALLNTFNVLLQKVSKWPVEFWELFKLGSKMLCILFINQLSAVNCGQLLTLGQTRQLESVQRSFTNRMNSTSGLSYWQRLKHLNIYSLERRRERYFIIYTWKILNSLVLKVIVEETGLIVNKP